MTARQRDIPGWPGWLALGAGLAFAIFSFVADAATWTGLTAAVCLLAGAWWLGLSGWRGGAHGLLLAFTLAALGLRLLTVEVTDDARRGVAVTWPYSVETESAAPPDGARYILGPAIGSFPGRALYRATVKAGWIAAPLVWLLAFAGWLPLARAFDLNVPFPRRRLRARSRRSARKRLVNYGLGYSFIFLGVLGIFLPILQGVLFLVIGFLFLARVSPRVRLARHRLRRRYPQWAHRYDRVERQARDWLRGRFGARRGRRTP